jgi:hypothetical protein
MAVGCHTLTLLLCDHQEPEVDFFDNGQHHDSNGLQTTAQQEAFIPADHTDASTYKLSGPVEGESSPATSSLKPVLHVFRSGIRRTLTSGLTAEEGGARRQERRRPWRQEGAGWWQEEGVRCLWSVQVCSNSCALPL